MFCHSFESKDLACAGNKTAIARPNSVANVVFAAVAMLCIANGAAAQSIEWRLAYPTNRCLAAMAYDPVRQVTVLVGGTAAWTDNGYGFVDRNTWGWNGERWSILATEGPEPRGGVGLVYDESRDRMVFFGERRFSPPVLAETWEWDGANWSRVFLGGPRARTEAGLAYDVARKKTVLYGDQSGSSTYLDDTWEWDGANWTQVASVGPRARYFLAMAYYSVQYIDDTAGVL